MKNRVCFNIININMYNRDLGMLQYIFYIQVGMHVAPIFTKQKYIVLFLKQNTYYFCKLKILWGNISMLCTYIAPYLCIGNRKPSK